MKTGPTSKPTEDLESWRKESREKRGEMQVASLGECPKPPAWLKKRSRYYWIQIAPLLHSHGLIAEPDIPALALLCDRMAQLERYSALVEGDEILVSENGARAHPLIRARDAAIADLRRLFADLGMTATARIGLPKVDRPAGKVLDATNLFPKG